jgi:hypothetical protein
MAFVAELDEKVQALFGGHCRISACIGLIRFFQTGINPDLLLHFLIIFPQAASFSPRHSDQRFLRLLRLSHEDWQARPSCGRANRVDCPQRLFQLPGIGQNETVRNFNWHHVLRRQPLTVGRWKLRERLRRLRGFMLRKQRAHQHRSGFESTRWLPFATSKTI